MGRRRKNAICGIYCIENIINNKKYIGKAINIKDRFYDHLKLLRVNGHYNEYLQRAFLKYGEENFNFYILEECEEEKLNEREIFLISFYKTNQRDFGYNLTDGGEGVTNISESGRAKIAESNRRRVYTQEQRDAFSARMKEIKTSEKYLKNLSDSLMGRESPMKGKHHTEETKKKMSESRKGREVKQETRDKISASNKGIIRNVGRKHTEEELSKMRLFEKGNQIGKGTKRTEEQKSEMSKKKIGIKNNKNSSSKFVGVSFRKDNNSWTAQAFFENEKQYLGCFPTEILAAIAYNEAAIEFHGSNAKLNIISEEEYNSVMLTS